MKKLAIPIFTLAIATSALAQSAETASPQTARQALIEMLFSKSPGSFAKHLPAATLAAITKSAALTTLQGYSMLATQFQHNETKEKSFRTFDTGPVLLSGVNQRTGDKYDVTVENDSLQGDTDKITISVRTYKGEQVLRTPYMPTVTASMKQESGVWTLNEVSLTVRIPLADPDFLQRITEGMKTQSQITNDVPAQPPGHATATSLGGDTLLLSAMRTILAAESTYKNTYRSVGYSCTLSDLDGFGAAESNEHHAMLIPSDLAGGRRYGYSFALSGCTGVPTSRFQLLAAPVANTSGRRTYCADQSGAIRFSNDGSAGTCFTSGVPLP
jgi:hypothetical protein